MIIDNPVLLRPAARTTALMWLSTFFDAEQWRGASEPMPEGHDRVVILRAYDAEDGVCPDHPCAGAVVYLEPGEDAYEQAGEAVRQVAEAIYGHHHSADWTVRNEPHRHNREQRRRAARRAARRCR